MAAGAEVGSPSPSDVLVWQEMAAQLDDAVLTLPPRDRRAVLLRFFEQKSIPQVAAALNLTEATARQRLSRAVEKLRARLAPRGGELAATGAAGFTSLLTAHAVCAAPPALLGSTCAAAGTAAGTASLNMIAKGAITMMTWAKIKTVAAVVAVTLLVGTGAVAALNGGFAREAAEPKPGAANAGQRAPEPQTLRLEGCRYIYFPDPEFPAFEKATVVPDAVWIDVPNARMRQISFVSSTSPATGERRLDSLDIRIAGELLMEARSRGKKVIYFRRDAAAQRAHLLKSLQSWVSSHAPGALTDYTKVGRESIDGKSFEIWERTEELPHAGAHEVRRAMRTRYWISADTGAIGRLEQWLKHEPSGVWQPGYIVSRLEWGAPIPADLFLPLDVPQGYEAVNTPGSPTEADAAN
jgi:hypothetical protein